MRAWPDFECESCGLLLTPNFEIAGVECAGKCERELWVCMNCVGLKKGARCGSCRLKAE